MVRQFAVRKRQILFLLCVGSSTFIPVGVAHAALDPEVKKPYQLQVVLRIAKHPLLTTIFKDEVTRELRDGLQAAMGNMGQVVVTDQHPLLQAIESQGLGPALDSWNQVSETKVHFVLIDFAGGQYVIQSRQLDGLTGMVSPLTRRDQTTDRKFVARIAALLIDRDFGVVGTVDPESKGDVVRVVLKGSGLGNPMDRWITAGDVFAIVKISRVGDSWRGKRVDWALLQAKDDPDKDGVCQCTLHQRYSKSLDPSSALGYRCIKLGTTTAPLRLRLVDEKSRLPLPDQPPVTISRFGFAAKVEEEHATDQDGFVTTRESYKNIAFVKVLTGAKIRAQIPIEILGDRTVTCELSNNPEAELLAQFELHRRQWENQVAESIAVADALFKELGVLVERKDHKTALAKAKAGLAGLNDDVKGRGDEMRRLRSELKELGRTDKTLEEARGVQALETQSKELERFIASVEKVVKEAPRRAELLGLVEQAHLHEDAAEYDEAIADYKKVLEKAVDEVAVKNQAEQRLKELDAAWTQKSAALKQARAFIYTDWPKRKTKEEIKAGIPDARRMFDQCKRADDKLTPRKLLKVNLSHIVNLTKQQDAIKAQLDDTKEAETLLALLDDLKKLTQDVSEFLRPAKGDSEKKNGKQ